MEMKITSAPSLADLASAMEDAQRSLARAREIAREAETDEKQASDRYKAAVKTFNEAVDALRPKRPRKEKTS